jgi:hypothetical protein
MKEGEDGTLFVSYNTGPHVGTWRYDYGTNQWTGLAGWTASVLGASHDDNTVFATFSGQGTWEYDGSWHQLASHDAYNLAGVTDGDVYAVFGGDKTGTWRANNGSWQKLTAAVPVAMDATYPGVMFASYSDGTYQYDGFGWTKETNIVATQIAAANDSEFYMTAAGTDAGTYEVKADTYFWSPFYNPDTWGDVSQMTPEVASHLSHYGSTSIGAYSSGTWTYDYNNSDWHQPENYYGPVTDYAYMFG